MNIPSRLKSSWLNSRAVISLTLVVTTLAVSGCRKKPTEVSAPIISADSPAPATPANNPAYPPPVTPTPIAAAAYGGVDLKALNHAYIGWIVQSHIRPKTFEEFIAKSGMQVPPPPAGKKYLIGKSGFINLANQ